MNQVKCEMCGGTELVKQDGVFVCQFCGAKYSPEEAKRLMIEGTVDVQGTVRVDNSDLISKYLQNARRAMQKEDWEEVEKYYNMVEQFAPNNIEAIFYSAFGKAKTTLLDADLFKRQAAFKVLKNCISIVDDNFDVEKEEEQKNIVNKMGKDLISMSTSNFVYHEKTNGYGIVTTDEAETITLFNSLRTEFMTTLENIAAKIPEEQKDKKIWYYLTAIEVGTTVLLNGRLANDSILKERIKSLHIKINEIDPSHAVPEEEPEMEVKMNKILAVVLVLLCWPIGLIYIGVCYAKSNKAHKKLLEEKLNTKN